jgi:Cytochrome c
MPKWWLILAGWLIALPGFAAEPTAAERGRDYLTQTAFIRGFWPPFAYDNAWKTWGLKTKPTDYPTAFRERYGLNEAPYANGKYPMGLRKADYLIGSGIGIDCMTCHGGSIFGKSMIGLGNQTLDVHSLFEDLYAASGANVKMPFTFSQARGTNEAGAFSVYLLGLRNDDLTLTSQPRDLDLHDDSCEDVPAWWLLKKKQTMYFTGATDTKSVRSIMQFMMHPLTTPKDFTDAEPKFRDVREYLLSLEAPKYPLPVDATLAAKGKTLFTQTCAKCHGSYGEAWTYPNKIIPLADIRTDPKRFENINVTFGKVYNASWFAQEGQHVKPIRETNGYQAPPLDGIWATAPYLHNGSVPTLEGVLNSKARPKIFTRSFRTTEADYDPVKVGWKVTECGPAEAKLPGHERRKIYDTTQPGRANSGHTYGDDLTPEERHAVIEYLKTL